MHPEPAMVLAYHAISPFPNPLSVDSARLRDQLVFLLAKGMRPVTFGASRDRTSPGRAFSVTFDDGFRSVYTRAWPILEELGIPATVFLPTACVGKETPVCWPGLTPDPMPSEELLPMGWAEVRELVAAGWEIGSHTVSHRRLPQLEPAALEAELRDSRRACEQETGIPCRTLAYPFGEADQRVIRAAREAGYVAAVTMARIRARGPLAVPRVGVYSHDNRGRFALKVSRPLSSDLGMRALSLARHRL
jgi:peptidoglycan/xylan/chitin deacetylase (PgdA/CDA1 family)